MGTLGLFFVLASSAYRVKIKYIVALFDTGFEHTWYCVMDTTDYQYHIKIRLHSLAL